MKCSTKGKSLWNQGVTKESGSEHGSITAAVEDWLSRVGWLRRDLDKRRVVRSSQVL